MEPDGLGGILGAVMGALGALAEPDAVAVTLNPDAPADFRPLRLVAAGRLLDVHPADLRALESRFDVAGQPALYLEFGPEGTDWLAATTTAHVGEPMAVLVCGEELMAAVVLEPLVTGEVVISGGLDLDTLRAIVAIVGGRYDCDGRALMAADAPAPDRPGTTERP